MSQFISSSYIFAMLPNGRLEPPSCHYLPWTTAYDEAGSRSVGTQKICPNYLNLFYFSACSKYRILGCTTLRLTSEAFTESSHHILPILRTQRFSNTENARTLSALRSHVLEQRISADVIAIAHT